MTMKAGVRRVLARAGFELRRTGQGPRRTLDDVLTHARASGLDVGTIVDVGVAGGTIDLYDAFSVPLLLIEPLAEWEPTLRDLTSRHGGRYVMAAAGKVPGELEMRVHRVPVLSSTRGERDLGQTQPRVVPVVTIDDETAQLPGPYLLKVDVEGAELDALVGATRTLEAASLVIVEGSLFELIPGQPLAGDLICYLRERDLVLYDLYGGHRRPLDGALAQIDLVFTPRTSILRTSQHYASPQQADALYKSWGR